MSRGVQRIRLEHERADGAQVAIGTEVAIKELQVNRFRVTRWLEQEARVHADIGSEVEEDVVATIGPLGAPELR